VQISAGQWSISGLAFMESFGERLRGIKSKGASGGVVLRSRSIQTFGLTGPLEILAIGANHRVLEVRTLLPNRLARFSDARLVVELPGGSQVPAVGSVIEMTYE
jgi:hypothetical protein